MCHLTAQALTPMDTSEHFEVLKLLGEGSYGKVMLAVHRKRGEDWIGRMLSTSTPLKQVSTMRSFPCAHQVLQWLWSSSLVSPPLFSPSWRSITSLCHSVPIHPWPELLESPTSHLHTMCLLSKPGSLAIFTMWYCQRYTAKSTAPLLASFWSKCKWLIQFKVAVLSWIEQKTKAIA